MPRLKELSRGDFKRRLAKGDLPLRIGPYTYNLRSDLATVATGLWQLYGDYALAEADEFIDFNIAISPRGLLQRFSGKTEFLLDEQNPFETIPEGQAYAFLEWGMNWCVSIHTNEYLKLHAAAVARNGAAIIMPGIPGAGKSTLCAALGLRGWRILSDEHAMIPPGETSVIPLCRPVSLKNESIAAVKSFSENAIFGPVSERTHKGVVAHMKADLQADSHERAPLPARVMVFPRYSKDESQQLVARRKTESFILAAYHSFNYSLLCETGFEAMKTLLDSVSCYDLVYRDLDWAVNTMEQLPEMLV